MGSNPTRAIQDSFGGVAQRQEHSLVRREAAGSSPVVPAEGGACRRRKRGRAALPRGRLLPTWWLWCNGSIRGRDPRGTGSNPVGRPCMWTLSTWRAPRAVTPLPLRCGGSNPPVRTLTRGRRSIGRAPRLHRGRCGFESHRLHLFASVVSTASTRPLYGRGAGSTPAGGSLRS